MAGTTDAANEEKSQIDFKEIRPRRRNRRN